MKSFALPLLALALVGMTLNIAAAQAKKQRKNDPAAQMKKRLAAAELPADVLKKCNDIIDEQGKKLSEAQAKVDAVLTAEQRQAQATAQKAAKQAGKKKKEAQAEVDAAAKLTDEQKTKLAAAQKELTAAQSTLQTALRGALTAEQQQEVLGKAKKKAK